jgi:hypothetical protein
MERFPLPSYIDSTMLTCFRSCPQKWSLEFGRGFRPEGISIDLHAGGCFANALEEVYRRIHLHKNDFATAMAFGHARFLTDWGDFEIPEYKKTAKTMDRMWEAIAGDGTDKGKGYFEVYSPLTDHVQPYFDSNGKPTFEYTFSIPLEPCGKLNDGTNFPLHPTTGEPFLYVGRFDMLGMLGGRPVVRDEKTTGGSIGQSWASQWPLRNQFIGYTWACRQCGIDLDTVVVRGIAIQKTQIVHAEAIVPYSDFLRQRWLDQLRRDMWRLVRCWESDYFDFNLGDACTAYGNCLFLNVCQSPNIDTWANDFVVRHWNPLDKNPIKEKANALDPV